MTTLEKEKPACTQHGTHKFQFTQYYNWMCAVGFVMLGFDFIIIMIITRTPILMIFLWFLFFRRLNFYCIIPRTHFYSFQYFYSKKGQSQPKKGAVGSREKRCGNERVHFQFFDIYLNMKHTHTYRACDSWMQRIRCDFVGDSIKAKTVLTSAANATENYFQVFEIFWNSIGVENRFH